MRCGQNRSTWCVGALALSLCLLTFSSGCGKGGKGNVSGEVTVAGKPLPIGTIVFTPSQGPAVAAEIIDGKYSAIGVPTGDVKVSLDLNSLKMLADQVAPKGGAAAVGAAFGKGVPEDTTKKKSMAPTAPPGGVEMPPEAKAQLAAQAQAGAEANRRSKDAVILFKLIPDKYTDPNASGWTLKVSSGDNTFDAKVTK